MPALLPHTQVFLGDAPVTRVHQGGYLWPEHFGGIAQRLVAYDERIPFDQAVTYDGLMLPMDITLTVGVTRRAAPPGATSRCSKVGPTHFGTVEVGPTRWGRRKERALPTRVTRYTLVQVQPTRGSMTVGFTQRSAMIGPTRVQRGK